MNIGKQKVVDSFLEKVKTSKVDDGSFYSSFKTHYVEEKLNLGGYGYVDVFFYKKSMSEPNVEGISEEFLDVRILTVCSTLIGFDEIIKSSRVKKGVFIYLRDIVGFGHENTIYYTNNIICPGFKEDGFETLSNDISDLNVFVYGFETEGFNLYRVSDRVRKVVPSNRVLKTIKRRVLK